MSLLDKASLIVTPNAYKESKLYSVIPSNGAGDMTVVRATTARRVNASGLIESVGVNIPRIDYTNGSCPSILVEPQRTNLIFPSATLTTQTRIVTAVSHTLSFYGTGSIVISGVHSATLTGTGLNNRVSLTFTPTAGSLILTVTGSVTNAQLEAGSYPTSYIPTVDSTVTRNADVISKTGISSLIGVDQGTFLFDLQGYVQQLFVGQPYWCYLEDSAKQLFFYDTGLYTTINGSFQFIANLPNGTIPFKVIYRWNTSFISIFINGVKIIDFAKTATFNPTFFSLGDAISTQNYNEIIGFKTALTDQECIALTTL